MGFFFFKRKTAYEMLRSLVGSEMWIRARIYTQLLTEESGDTLTVHLVPNRRHLIRVTLRGCRRGERIRIGNLQYVCTGEMDEQAFTRFSPTDQNTVTISGDRHFCCEQVQEVESICL